MKNSQHKISKFTTFLFAICIISGGLFFFASSNQNTQAPDLHDTTANLEKATFQAPAYNKENFNILILGKGGQEHISGYLTDTIIIANIQSFPNDENKISLISIPRDLFVKINLSEENSYYSRINAIKSIHKEQGLSKLKKNIWQITGLPIQHSIEIDFEAFRQTIDTLGCVSVYVEKDIYDPLFPGPNFSYKPFSIKEGWHCMNGDIALKYVRSRHSAFGDLDRIKRQQQIIEAIKINLLSPRTLFNFKKLLSLYDNLNNNIETDLNLMKIKNLYSIIQDTKAENIINISIDTNEAKLLTTQNSPTSGSILVPIEGLGKYDMIKEYIENIIFY